jgi:MoxR-like ATPase
VAGYELGDAHSNRKITVNDIRDAYFAGENILLTGPSGCGKSSLAFWLMDEANEPVRIKNRRIFQENTAKSGKNPTPYHSLPYELAHLSCKESTRSEELVGTVTMKINPDGSREPIVVYGAVTDAWIHGKTLIIEEMDFAPPGVWGEAHQFFDGRTQETCIYINGPMVISKHSRFRVMATCNTLGLGENQLEYAGTQVLNRAFLNRFTYIVKMTWLPEDKEVQIVYDKTGIRRDVIGKMVGAATQSRSAHAAGTVDTAITTRDLLSWSRECAREEVRRKKEKFDSASLPAVGSRAPEKAP